MLQAHVKQHSGVRNFKCEHPDCGKSYFQVQRLRQHIKIVHEKIRGECPIADCKATAGRYDYMRNHLLKHTELNEEDLQRYIKIIKQMNLA